MSTTEKIKKLERKRASLLKQMLRVKVMIRGTLGETYRRCGKANCWCAEEEKGHPYLRITWTEKGKPKTRAVSKENLSWVAQATENYRQFRTLRTEVKLLNEQLRHLLDEFEVDVIAHSNK